MTRRLLLVLAVALAIGTYLAHRPTPALRIHVAAARQTSAESGHGQVYQGLVFNPAVFIGSHLQPDDYLDPSDGGRDNKEASR